MNQIESLARQTSDAYEWTNKLLASIPQEKWEEMPPVIETNVGWQVGHLIISIYFHSIWVVAGHQQDIIQQVPIKLYGEYFTDAPPKRSLGIIHPEELYRHLKLMEQKSITVIRMLAEEDLDKELEFTPISHPVAKNKWEALDWNIKHTMWHCGQLGMLKRVTHERFDFGLRKA